jgi:hypothetical protein
MKKQESRPETKANQHESVDNFSKFFHNCLEELEKECDFRNLTFARGIIVR